MDNSGEETRKVGTMSMRELSPKEKLARYTHFRALMESYWRYVDRHGIAPRIGTRKLKGRIDTSPK